MRARCSEYHTVSAEILSRSIVLPATRTRGWGLGNRWQRPHFHVAGSVQINVVVGRIGWYVVLGVMLVLLFVVAVSSVVVMLVARSPSCLFLVTSPFPTKGTILKFN